MRNVRRSPQNSKVVQSSKKNVKRLKPKDSVVGNSFMKKLEPTLPLPRRTKFQSPYKNPQVLKKTINPNEEPKVINLPPEKIDKPVEYPVKVIVSNDKSNKTSHTEMERDKNQSKSAVIANDKRALVAKTLSSLPKMSPVKIQPIDPYTFCEPVLNDCIRRKVAKKDIVFKRSKEEQRKVEQEVLDLIKRTAETIKIIRKQHKEWKKRQH